MNYVKTHIPAFVLLIALLLDWSPWTLGRYLTPLALGMCIGQLLPRRETREVH